MITHQRRWLIAAVAAMIFALLAAGWQGWIHWSARNQPPDLVVPITEQVTVRGVSYRIEEVRTGDELPAGYGDDPIVRAPDGATMILVIMTTEITDDQVKPDENYCEATLIDSSERIWRTESDLTFKLKRPEALSCTGTLEEPIKIGQPLQVGFSFVVPDDAVPDVDLRLDLFAGDSYVINFSR